MIPKLKVCGMRDSENIQELVKIKPDYIGFIFYAKSPRFLGNDYQPQTLNIIPESIQKVGVFVNETEEKLLATKEKYHLQALQLHGNESPELCAKMQQNGCTVIKAFQMDESFDFSSLIPYKDVCDFFLFDTKTKEYGGSGHKFDWKILNGYDNSKPIFLSGGITLEDIDAIKQLSNLNIYAIDINSRFETAPALKDIKRIKTFSEALRGSETQTIK